MKEHFTENFFKNNLWTKKIPSKKCLCKKWFALSLFKPNKTFFFFVKNLKLFAACNSKTRLILVTTPPNPCNFSLPKTSFPNGTRVLGYYKVNLLEISRYDICAGNVLKTVSFNFSSNLLFDKSNTVNFFIGAKNLAGICWMAFSVKFNTCNLTIFTKSCFFSSVSLFLARLRWCIFSVMLLWISTVVKYPTLEGKISYILEETLVRQSSNGRQVAVRQSSVSHLAVIRRSSGNIQAAVRQSSNSHQTVIKQSSGNF